MNKYSQLKNAREERQEKIIGVLGAFLTIAILFSALYLATSWSAKQPIVKFSQGQQKVVAVIDSNGKQLLKAPLPEKYMIIYVE